jgi:very-short-patch-repair endonuclease
VFSTDLADHFRNFYGIASDDELRRYGITVAQRERLVAEGLFVAVHKGVYRLRSTPESLHGRCRAICLRRPDAVVTGRAAGRLWGVRRMGAESLIDVRVPHFANAVAADGIRFRRCSVLDPVDVVHRPDGIRLVSPPRLLFDLSAVLTDLELESVMEQVLDPGWCTLPTIHETGRRLCHPARPGSTRFARVVGSRPAWLKPADSDLEVLLFDALRRRGVGGLVRQHRLDLPGGWAIHADIAVPELRWAIPVDHVTWHGGRLDAQRDKENDRQAALLGWFVSRVTDEDIDLRLPIVTEQLVQLYRRRRLDLRLAS